MPKEEVTFYDPHPGFKGCLIPLPVHMKTTVDWLSGRTMTLDEAMEVLKNAVDDSGIEKATLKLHDDWISLKMGEWSDPPVHAWRLIRFMLLHHFTIEPYEDG